MIVKSSMLMCMTALKWKGNKLINREVIEILVEKWSRNKSANSYMNKHSCLD